MANGETTLNTGGGAATGNIQTSGGTFVGRDQINFIVPLGSWEQIQRLLFKDKERTKASKAMQEQFQSFDWAKAEQAYLDKVIKLYDRVRILGNSADVPLGNLFTQVYILDKPTARYRHDIEELRKRGYDRLAFQRQPGERINGLALVKQGQNLFILGKPGAGKTTFLKYITIQAAHKQLSRIPIFVSLNQWADSRWGKGDKAALLPFLVEQFAICDFPDADLFIDYLLRAGRALVLFDGLDEVKQEKEQRRRLTRLLQDFARKYDKSQYLITCRIAASDYVFDGFADVEVADFTREQIQEYARNWFGKQVQKVDTFTTELAKAENKGLAELCNTPLLLSLLCLTFDNNLRFPPNRAELYEDALDTLLRKWDSSRSIQRDEIYRELSHKRKLQLLMSIAVPTFQKGELFFRQRDLEKWLVAYLAKLPKATSPDTMDGTALLKAMEAQHSILVERAQGIYSFSHLTFQEYLTARYLADNQGKDVTDDLIGQHLTDQRWREVFLLTASLLDDGDEFLTVMRHAIDGIVVDAPILMQLLTWSHDRAHLANPLVEKRAVVQLAYIYLALDFALTLDLTLDLALDLASARERTSALVRERPRSLSLELARTRTHLHLLNLDSARARKIDLDLDLACAIASETTSLVGFDYGLYYVWVYATLFAHNNMTRTDKDWQTAVQQYSSLVDGVAALASEAGLADIATQLIIQFPSLFNGSEQSWQQYANALFVIQRDKRDLRHQWTFSQQESDKLKDYLYANELLVQCLKVVAVSDRQAILNGLLLPPEVRQEEQKIGSREENQGVQP